MTDIAQYVYSLKKSNGYRMKMTGTISRPEQSVVVVAALDGQLPDDCSLISAAPDLLEAAKSLIQSLKRFSDAPSDRENDERWHFEVLPSMRSIEAAISKAEGLA